jgi:Protein of unknown function (DUF2581).
VTVTDSAVVREPAVVRVRPHRIRVVCWIAAPVLVVTFVLLAVGLHGSTGAGQATFQRGDQLAMAGLGVLGAAAVLLFTRPLVEADARGIRVRNVVGGYELPWDVVRGIRFDRGSAWASVELDDDELLPILALQVVDRERAVDGVRALRTLHAAHHRTSADPG